MQNLLREWQNVLDVLLVASIFFLLFVLVRGTRAATLLRGIALVLVLVYSLSALLDLQAFSFLLSRTLTALAVALPVIFQDELRRWLDQVGRFGLFNLDTLGSDTKVSELITEVSDASRILSQQRHGALIVFERSTGLQEFIESGTRVDATITSVLLQTIFFPKTALHDGAVIIRGDQIAAAGCTLPVSSSRRMPDRRMGLRHRAALGMSEVSDAVIVVISEETGRISVVVGGRFVRRGIDSDSLPMVLGQYIKAEQRSRLSSWFNQMRQITRNLRAPAKEEV
ncbi:MAG: TIGR00159 family protein [Chloroflexi bacterium]|nr:TIGR00159 family protein [Chloroflexota bacterium]